MKKNLLLILLTISSITLLFAAEISALEGLSCLTCHRYPGLVRLEETGEFKVLHIDSEDYFNSPHRDLRCQDCHTGVKKVPHAGERKTDCLSRCHKEEKDKLLVTDEKKKAIHRGEQSLITNLKEQSSCREGGCHPIYPHSKEVFVRAMLNLHTGYLFCEVCHLDRKQYKKISYSWITNEDVQFKGKPFGSFYDPREKAAKKAETSISRIVPFSMGEEKGRPIIHSWEPGSDDDDYHKGVSRMEVIVACHTCHSPKGLMNFRALGFSSQRTTELVSMNIKALISKYESFHLPAIFEP